jgi:hypothetical protein
MPVKLIVAAAKWNAKGVKCTFTVWADEVIQVAKDRSKQIYELPERTKHVRIAAMPTPKTNPYWDTMVALDVAGDGTVTPGAGFAPWVTLKPATGATAGAIAVVVKVSRFKEVTHDVVDLLKVVPGAPGVGRKGGAPTKTELVATYGAWPPSDLGIPRLSAAHYLDVVNPVKAGGILSFATADVSVASESVVLELKGARGPRLFGVVWPTKVERKIGSPPTPFFFYLRQTGGQDRRNVFVGGAVKGPYPYNFDYAERCLFESQHYPGTPIFVRKGWMLRPKGVPYQVAKSGAKVVTVFPVADSDDDISYEALSNFDEMGLLLSDLQAFMFWKVGISAPPDTVGKTALSAFSSSNYTLASWLNRNTANARTFLKTNISAVYFLDAPNVDDCVDAGLRWRQKMGTDKRVRLYSARDEKKFEPAYRRLIGLKPADPLASPPYLISAADTKITLALFPTDTWDRTFKDQGIDIHWKYWDAHHFVLATVLTHALSQQDI